MRGVRRFRSRIQPFQRVAAAFPAEPSRAKRGSAGRARAALACRPRCGFPGPSAAASTGPISCGSKISGPYHSRALNQSFQVLAATFAGLVSARLRSRNLPARRAGSHATAHWVLWRIGVPSSRPKRNHSTGGVVCPLFVLVPTNNALKTQMNSPLCEGHAGQSGDPRGLRRRAEPSAPRLQCSHISDRRADPFPSLLGKVAP